MFKSTSINTWLKDQYGSHHDGRARFRVVFADSEVEKRFGDFAHYVGHIYVGSAVECAEVKKYPGPEYEHCWILEVLIVGADNPELPGSIHGSYEPVWTFRGKNGVPVPPTEKAIILLMDFIFNPIKKTPSDISDDARIKWEKDQAEMKEMLDDQHGSFLVQQLVEGEAVSLANMKRFE